MSEAPKVPTAATSSFAEAKAFMKAKKALDELEAQYPKAFAALRELAPVYNAQLKAFAAVCKEKRFSCGPIELYSFSRKLDGEALYAAVGRQTFASFGGVIDPETHSVDKARFDALLAAKKIPVALEAKVVSTTPSFHKPSEIVLP